MVQEIRARMINAPQVRTDGYGIDHNIWIAIADQDNVSHLPCPIPLERYAELSEPMTNAERVELYRSLIIEFYNSSVPSPEIPQAPSNLSDLTLWDAYYDAKIVYDTQLASNIVDAETYATQATSWIEGLAAFENWPFNFVLQLGD